MQGTVRMDTHLAACDRRDLADLWSCLCHQGAGRCKAGFADLCSKADSLEEVVIGMVGADIFNVDALDST